MVDTNDKGTESDEDEEMLEAFSLSPKDLATPAAGVGLKHLPPSRTAPAQARPWRWTRATARAAESSTFN